MTTPFLALILSALTLTPGQAVLADDGSTSSLSAPATGSTTGTATGGQGDRGERIKEAMAELNLTDAQKEQIKQIRANTQPGKDRRQQIMAVLTPDQKARLIQMFQQYKSEQ